MFTTRWWSERSASPADWRLDDAFLQVHHRGIGAESKAQRSTDTPDGTRTRTGRVGGVPNPPFHTPVFVLTHHTRPSLEMEGGTTFHFLDASPAEALEVAREAADGLDIRIGGGPTVVREFLSAGLVDHIQIVVVPVLLGRGVRLWDGLEGLEKHFQVEATSSPSGVTHVTFTRAGVWTRASSTEATNARAASSALARDRLAGAYGVAEGASSPRACAGARRRRAGAVSPRELLRISVPEFRA